MADPDEPPPPPGEPLKPTEKLKTPLWALVKQLNLAEVVLIASLFGGAFGLGFKCYPEVNPPGPPCPTAVAIRDECQGLQPDGSMIVNVQHCVQLGTQAQLCGKPDVALSLFDLAARNGSGEGKRYLDLMRPQTSPCVGQATVAGATPDAAVRADRQLDDAEKQKLTKALAQWPGKRVNVVVGTTHHEARRYGRQIFKWLKEQGRTLARDDQDDIDTTQSELVGESVHLDHLGTEVWIEIGVKDEESDY